MTGTETDDIAPGTALLMVDFQDWILDRYVPCDGAVATSQAEQLHRRFRDRGMLVLHVRHQVEDPPPPATWGLRGDIANTIAVETDEWVLTKTTISAFGVPMLHELLQQGQIATVMLTGVVTEAAVRQTALDAISRGYEVVISAGGVASSTQEIKNETLSTLESAGVRIR